jgi:hypothetical protein
MMLPSVCVAMLRGCTARPASRSRWCRPTTGVGEDGVPSPAGRTCVPTLQPTIRTQLGKRCAARPRTCCRHHPSRRSPQRAIVTLAEAVTQRSTGGSTRRRRGRENSPSRPTIWGTTVVVATVVQLAIPVVRTAVTTALVSTDAQIGSNLYQQATGERSRRRHCPCSSIYHVTLPEFVK